LEHFLDFPETLWYAQSKHSTNTIALIFTKLFKNSNYDCYLTELTGKAPPQPDHYIIQSSDFLVLISGNDKACRIMVDILTETPSPEPFFRIWRILITQKIISGGSYEKNRSFSTEFWPANETWSELEIIHTVIKNEKEETRKQPWELLPPNTTPTERKIVELWCQDKTAKEISEFTGQPGWDFYKKEHVLVKISNLRKTYDKAGIPTEKERNKARKKFLGRR